MAVPYFRMDLDPQELAAVEGVLRSGWLTTGAETARFEQEFAAAIGGDVEAIAVNSNTSGMHLALEAAGISAGDEVIVPTLTFTATAEVVHYLGAHPVMVDVDPTTLCIDPQRVRAAITPKTRAIMPVHFGGLAADIESLQVIADEHGLAIVEDAAHSFPTTRSGVPIGRHRTAAAVFSFYANKTITTGEGGMIVTADPAIARRCRIMRLHGIDRDAFDRFRGNSAAWKYDVVAPGFKYNMTDVAAALGRRQLAKAEAMRMRREEIARLYSQGFADLSLIVPPPAAHGDIHSWHLYPIQAPLEIGGRSGLESHLTERGIGYSVHYTPLHRLSFWREKYGLRPEDFPVSEAYFERCLSLPIYPAMSDSDVSEVVAAVRTGISQVQTTSA